MSRAKRQVTPAPGASPASAPAGASAAASAGGDQAGAPPGAPRRRRWGRRLLLLAVLALLLRALLGLALPSLLESLARDQGWGLTYQRLELSLSTLDVELAHIDLVPLAGEGPSAHLEYARVDVSVWHLLMGEVVIPRVEVDGLDLEVERRADGTLVLPTPADGDADAADDTSAEDELPDTDEDDDADDAADDDGPLDLSSPVRLDALRLQNVQLSYTDRSVDPPLVTRVDLDVRGSDLGAPQRHARLSVGVSASGLLDRLWLELSADSAPDLLDASLDLRVGGLDLRPARDLLRPMGLVPREAPLTLDLSGALVLESTAAGLGWSLGLSGLHLAAAGTPALTLETLSAQAPAQRGSTLQIAEVLLAGLTARATIEADGGLSVPGLLFVEAAPSPPEADEPEPDDDDGAGGLAIESLRIVDQHVVITDRSVVPTTDLELELSEFVVAHLSTVDTQPTDLSLELVVPGVLERLTLGGQVTPTEAGGELRLDLAVAGLDPQRLTPHLGRAGLRSHFEDASLASSVRGSWRHEDDGTLVLDGTLQGLTLKDAAGITSLGDLAVESLRVPADGGPVQLTRLGLTGFGAVVTLHDDGRVGLPGLELLPAPVPGTSAAPAPDTAALGAPPSTNAANTASVANTANTASTAASAAAASTPGGPSLLVDLIQVDDNRLRVVLPDGRALQIADWDLRLAALAAGDGPLIADELSLSLAVPGLVRRLLLSGALADDGGDQTVALSLDAEGLQGELLASLAGEGAVPTLEDARLVLDVSARVAADQRVDVELTGLALTDGGREWLGLDRLAVVDLRADGATSLAALELDGPRLALLRGADGSLRLPGLTLPPAAAPDSTAAAGTTAAPVTTAAPSSAPAPAPTPDAPPPATLSLTRLAVRGGRVAWRDEALPTALDQDLTFALQLDDLTLGPDAGPAQLALELGLPGALESLRLTGSVVPAPERPSLDLALAGEGLTWTSLLPYLPPGSGSTLTDGRLDLALAAEVTPAEGGGQAVDVRLTGLRLGEGRDGPTLLGLERLALSAPRLDPAAPVWHVAELVLEGVVAAAAEDADGALLVAGLRLPPAPVTSDSDVAAAPGAQPAAGASTTATDAAATGTSTAGTTPGTTSAAVAGTTTASSASGSLVPATPVPHLDIERLDLGLARLSWQAAGGQPLAVADLRLVNEGAIRLDPDSDGDPLPFDLLLTGRVPPLVDALALRATLAPFAVEPSLKASLDVTGVRGDQLALVLPATAEGLDASQLSDGRLHLELSGTWLGRRRHALDFGTSGGVTGELHLDDLSLRDGPEGEVLVGLDELRLDIEKALGRSGDVRLTTLELVRPAARIGLAPEGLWVAGLLLKAAPTEALTDEAVVVAEAVAAAGQPAEQPPVEPESRRRAGPGAGPDIGPDAGPEAGRERRPEAPPRDGPPAPASESVAGPDAGPDIGPGAGPEAGRASDPGAGEATAAGSTPSAGSGATPADPGPVASTQDTTGAAAGPANPEDAPAAGGTAPTAPTAPTPEPLRSLDKLILSGADIVFTDSTVDPPLVLPLVGLDAEVTGLTNRALTEKRRIDYALMLQGGVPASLPPGHPPRPALDELEVSGWIVPYPTRVGRTQIDLRAFDLLTVQGHAAAAGVTLTDGVFDTHIELEFEEDGDLDTSSQFWFTDLDVSEPADGPISRFLRLPAPLNVVIAALRKDGVLEIPLSIEVPADGLSLTALVGKSLETLGRLIATAIAQAPLRVVGGVTEGMGALVGLGGDDERVAGDPVELPFEAGTSALTDTERQALHDLALRLADDEGLLLTLSHQVGAEDVARLSRRANPPAAWAVDVATRLRFHMGGLVREQTALAIRLRGLLAAGLEAEAEEATEALLDLEARIGAAAQAVDDLYEVIRPGAERLALRRTRTMCLAMAELRLAEVAAALRAELDEDDQGRVRVLPPRFSGETDRETSTVTAVPSLGMVD